MTLITKISTVLSMLLIFEFPAISQDIHQAAREGDLEMVKALLEESPEFVNQGDRFAFTPLHQAVSAGHVDIIEYIISRGGDVNARDIYDRTPLHFASSQGNVDIVQQLIEHGAVLDPQNNYLGRTPLHDAVVEGRIDIAKLLIERGSDANLGDYGHKTPLQLAVELGRTSLVHLLMSERTKINKKEKSYGRTFLHIAAIKGYRDIVDLLLRQGAKIDVRDDQDKLPLDYAAKYGHRKIAELLISFGTDENPVEVNYGMSPFLTKNLKEKEAVIWYLYGCGWAVKTKNCLLIFDYWEHGNLPDEPSLANGHIHPDEIKDQNVYVFVSHGDSDHYDEVIFEWEKYIPNITYIFGWKVKENPGYIYMEPCRSISNQDLEIVCIRPEGAVTHKVYLVKVDGLTILHPGDYNSTRYFEIDSLTEHIVDLDILFLPYYGGEWSSTSLVETLKPRVMFPMHQGGDEHNFRQLAKDASRMHLETKVYCPENSGDHFFYGKGSIVY